ncbi:MAG: glucosaminidase domain-containing protein [Clostridia bacterium]|nr:glucosaminidase domain-containing protein [Clostridia bacterium]
MAKFSQEVINLAQASEQKYGVPASVTLAQYALESGYGTTGLATSANNYFGITGTYKGSYVRRNGRNWRKYPSMEESFDDHGRLLSSGQYAKATKGVTSASGFIDAIAEIYAPSSDGNNNYTGTLKQIIRDNNLTQYDGTTSGGMTGGGRSDVSGGFDGGGGYGSDKDNEGFFASAIRVVVYIMLAVLAFILVMVAFESGNKTKESGVV